MSPPTQRPTTKRPLLTVLAASLVGFVIVLAGVTLGYAVVDSWAPRSQDCSSVLLSGANDSTVDNRTFAQENAPPNGVIVNASANSITVHSPGVTLLVEGAPWWYPRSGNYFLSYGLVDPQIVFPTGEPVHFEFINMDNESHTFTLTTQPPPYSYMPMMNGGGMMGMSAGSGCWLPVGSMMVGGTTAAGADPLYSATSATVEFSAPITLWYLCMMPGHAQSGMYGQMTVAS